MREEGGYFWPDSDTQAAKAALAEVSLIERWGLLGLRECVQAGGQVGVYPKALARKFETVYTFEPDWENFACLLANRMPDNVIAQQAALMDKPGGVSLYRVIDNAGAHYVLGEGQIPAVTIDSLGLTRCDLIQLDIEGAELRALQGAVDTLERCHPMLVIEVKDHGQRFGYDKGHLYEWLSKRGYRQTAKVHRDEIWKWPSCG